MAIRFIQSLCTAFLNSDISQGSVATFAKCGGMFGIDVIANLLTSLSVNYENRLAFGEVTDRSVGTRFYWPTLYV